MAATAHSRHPSNPPFSAVDTHLSQTKDEVESPSLSNPNALARFEFEPGLSKEGTKILMIEWEDDASTRAAQGSWSISWEGKTTVLPADDDSQAQAPSGERNSGLHRMYFLLPPGVAVPPSITLTKGNINWRTNALPAIFSKELGASATQAGKKGVLHTIWAKKRLQALQREIDAESKNNVEGIGLTMVLQEKEWIEQNFGVSARPSGLSISTGGSNSSSAPLSPGSPRSPGGGRLMEKLKGLKLGTTDRELGSSSIQSREGVSGGSHESNPLSPESSDVAVSSFSVFKGSNPRQLSAKPPQLTRKISSQGPPAAILAQQQQSTMGMGSLDALAAVPAWESRGPPPTSSADDDKEDGLFALPISPRSPEMTKSPFSFARTDTQKYVKEGQAA